MSILKKTVSLDSLKIDGPHIGICIYSTQMSKLNQIKAKTKWEKKNKPKPKKSVEMAQNLTTMLIFTFWSLSQENNYKHDILFCPHIFT